MSKRTQRMRERMFTGWNPIGVERLRIMRKTYEKYGHLPAVIREAHFIENMMDEFPIWIQDDELIVGAGSSKPNVMEACFGYGKWTHEDVDSYRNDQFNIPQDDLDFLDDCIDNFAIMGNQDLVDLAADDRFDDFLRTGYIAPPWPKRKEGHVKGSPRSTGGMAATGIGPEPPLGLFCLPYEELFKIGIEGILERVKKARDDMRFYTADSYQRVLNLDAMEMSLKAFVRYCKRYVKLAQEMAEKETDPVRKQELLDIAAICDRVPEKPARTFREAMQFFWFLILIQMPGGVLSFGRMDQIFYPYYKADIEAGRITDEEVVELFECLRLKSMEQDNVQGKANRERSDGKAKWFNAVIGGTKADGSEASNELTMLILQALQNMPTPHHTITLRVSENTPEEVMQKAIECQTMGLSMPAFVSDSSYIKYWTENWDMPYEDAVEWCICGCLDAVVPGKTNRHIAYMSNPNLMMLGWMNNGVDPNYGLKVGPDTPNLDSFKDFEEMYENLWQNGFYFYQRLCAERVNLETYIMRAQNPRAIMAALMLEPIEQGLCFWDDWNKYDYDAFSVVGFINTAESLCAIKKLVYEDKELTLSEFKKALDANWEGYEDLHRKVLSLPHYGNDNDEVDSMVARIYDDWAKGMYHVPGKLSPCGISISAYDPLGRMCPATPDGRNAGDILADGCASCVKGGATDGFLSMVKSAMKIDQDQYSAFLYNQKFTKDAITTERDKKKFGDVIKTYLTHGGKHVQFIIENTETLQDAKVNPEDHKELMVRVAGYSAYFTMLSERVQDQIIERNTFDAV